MVFLIILQLIVSFGAIVVLRIISNGRISESRSTAITYYICLAAINLAYGLELMGASSETMLMARVVEFGALAFAGFFMCSFYCSFLQIATYKWFRVYIYIYGVIMAGIAVSNPLHQLMFKNPYINRLLGTSVLSYEYGVLFPFFVIGCELVPAIVLIVIFVKYLIAESNKKSKQKALIVFSVLFVAMVLLIIYSIAKPSVYNPLPIIALIIVGIQMIYYWIKNTNNIEKTILYKSLDSLTEGVLVIGTTGVLIGFNKVAADIFDGLEEKYIGKNAKRIRKIPLEFFEDFDVTDINYDDKHYDVRKEPIVDSTGDIKGYVIVITDSTVIYEYMLEIDEGLKRAEKAEEEARAAQQRAEEANLAKSDFLANVSHEIRTPMNAIVGLSELIIEESMGRKVGDFAIDIKNASINLLAIINDILDLSQVESGKMKLDRVEYSTEQMLSEMLHLGKINASAVGLQLKSDISPELPCKLIGDEARIRQLITNFMTFGMKFTEKGYVKLSVSHKRIDKEICIIKMVFEDTGEGFDEDEINKQFDDFTRRDEVNDKGMEGIGLGIAISKRFVDVMNGSVRIESTKGEGTVCKISFPQKIADIRTIQAAPIKKQEFTDKIQRAFIVPGYKILVVDDNKINIKVAVGALSPYQFDIDEAKSGAQAIDMVMSKKYDIIFMDHMMPEMDGVEATQRIRSECGENGKAPVIIALSANAYNGAKQRFIDSGFQDFIAKPIENTELRDLLVKWIPESLRKPFEETEEAQFQMKKASKAELFMSGIDIDKALSLHSGGIDSYLEILELYHMDGKEKQDLITRLASEEDYKNYEIEVHGLKSASANIGATDFSELCKKHEFATKDGEYDFIQSDVNHLINEYRFILREVERVLVEQGKIKVIEVASGDIVSTDQIKPDLEKVLHLIEDFESKQALELTENLLSINMEEKIREALNQIHDKLKMYDDETAENIARELVNNI